MYKIAIVIADITKPAGTERAVTSLSNFLIKYGEYKVSILSLYSVEGDRCFYDLDSEVRIEHLCLSLGDNVLKRSLSYVQFVKKANALIKRESYDFVLGTSHSINCMLTLLNGKIKKVACEHLNYMAPPVYSRAIRKICYPHLDAVVLLTSKDQSHYSFLNNTHVIPNSTIIHDDASTCHNKIMLAVGRYNYQKGFDTLIDAFSIVHAKCPDWTLRIVGGGEEKSLLVKKIQDYKLSDCVELIPHTDRIHDEYINAGMYVLSSRFEGFGLVLVEAKDAGLPVVAFDCPEGPRDIVCDGKDGFLVESGNVNGLADKMIILAEDEDMRMRFGSYGKEDVKRYSPCNIFRMWDGLFNTLY